MTIDHKSLQRYFHGKSSYREKNAIRQWLDEDKSNREIFLRERIMFDSNLIFSDSIEDEKKSKIQNVLLICLGVAASLLILLSSMFVFQRQNLYKITHSYQCINVPAYNRSSVTLPDGTIVWLNSKSTLKYPLAFDKKKREVFLDGEGYFEVKKGKHPFIVKTNKYDIEVLGTVFNVDAYSVSDEFSTSLFQGKVRLINATNSMSTYLLPGQTASLDNEELVIKSSIDANKYLWKDGIIYLDSKSFPEIMKIFERVYDIKIIINNPSAENFKYRGKFRISDGIEHALRVLQSDFPFTFMHDDNMNVIIID